MCSGQGILSHIWEISIREIDAAVKMATERNVDAILLLPEVERLLLTGTRKTFSEMAKIDQRLRARVSQEKMSLYVLVEDKFQK